MISKLPTEDKSMPVTNPRIVFMGTPVFAVESLKVIVETGYQVVAVVTAPDKPSGRGQKVSLSPVKEYALGHNLNLLQPVKLKDPEFLQQLRQYKPDLQVVVAFRMMPEEVWQIPPLGTFNLHASMLPDYRGAAPINWAIINGETKTGVTTFFINHNIDTGSILLREEIQILPNETAGEVHDRLIKTGASLVVQTIESIKSESFHVIDQDHLMGSRTLKTAPKINKQDCKIDWNKRSRDLYNFIRGLSPSPCAWSEIICKDRTKQIIKVFFAEEIYQPNRADPGTIETDGSKFLRVATSDGYLSIKSLQLQGKKKLEISEFLRGFPKIRYCKFL